MAEVVNNEAEGRYEMAVDGGLAIAAYSLEDGVAAFTHTEVPEQSEGQGVGTRLVEGALSDARTRGWKIEPLCAFVAHYVEAHPEVQDLVA